MTNKEQASINWIGPILNSIHDIEQVLSAFLNEVRSRFDVTGTSVWIVDKETGDVVCREATGVQSDKVCGYRLGPKKGIAGWVSTSGESVIVSDTRKDRRHYSAVDRVTDIEIRSILGIPLRARGGIIGTIQLVDAAPHRFNATHQTLLEALAGPAAVIIENARLITDLKNQTETLSKTNIKLEAEIHQRRRAEAELNKYKQQLEKKVERQIVELDRSQKALAVLKGDINRGHRFGKMIGKSESMRAIYTLIQDLADVFATVLITGESGTGKELVAESLHTSGRRQDKPFIKVNCAALSESVLESELFGHVKGAFTGADRNRIGRFQKAGEGTILLDECGEISLHFQKRLLRVLQEREFERLGDTTTLPMKARIIAATNQDLLERIRLGAMRQDLYYRLKVMEIRVPPLRERKEDIPLLAHHFINVFNEELGKKIETVSPEVLRILMNHHWPGNVRELRNTLEHICILSKGGTIVENDLPSDFPGHDSSVADLFQGQPRGVKRATSQPRAHGRETLLKTLEQCQWNKTRAAEILGISRRTLYRRLKEYQL